MSTANLFPYNPTEWNVDGNGTIEIIGENITVRTSGSDPVFITVPLVLDAGVDYELAVTMFSEANFKMNAIFCDAVERQLLSFYLPYKSAIGTSVNNFFVNTPTQIDSVCIKLFGMAGDVVLSDLCLCASVVVCKPGTTIRTDLDGSVSIENLYAGVHRVYRPKTDEFVAVVHNYRINLDVEGSRLPGGNVLTIGPYSEDLRIYYVLVLENNYAISADNRIASCYGLDRWTELDYDNTLVLTENTPV
jgi:hypothetical protein